MPLRPDLPAGLNLSRRATTPVKLPKMNFPMVGGVPESGPGHAEPAQPQPMPAAYTAPTPLPAMLPEEVRTMPMMPNMPPHAMNNAPAPAPVASAREASRVLVYGRAGCAASMEAISDLIERQVSFTYFDVSRDAQAMSHLQTICGASGQLVVPVIIQIGFGAT